MGCHGGCGRVGCGRVASVRCSFGQACHIVHLLVVVRCGDPPVPLEKKNAHGFSRSCRTSTLVVKLFHHNKDAPEARIKMITPGGAAIVCNAEPPQPRPRRPTPRTTGERATSREGNVNSWALFCPTRALASATLFACLCRRCVQIQR